MRRSFGDSLETDMDDDPEIASCGGGIFGLTTAPARWRAAARQCGGTGSSGSVLDLINEVVDERALGWLGARPTGNTA